MILLYIFFKKVNKIMPRTKSKIHILSEILMLTKRRKLITLDKYMENPDNFEIVRGNIIVEKEKVRAAQANFRKNYDKVKEFFD